jgi:ATP-dependent Zn protease
MPLPALGEHSTLAAGCSAGYSSSSSRFFFSFGSNKAVPLSTLYAEIHKGNVARVVVDGDELVVTFRTNTIINGMTANAFRTALPPGMSGSWGFMQWLLDNSGAEVRIEPVNNLLVNLFLPLVPWLLILGFIWFFVFRQFRNVARTRQQPMRVVVVNQEEA